MSLAAGYAKCIRSSIREVRFSSSNRDERQIRENFWRFRSSNYQ